MTLLGAVGHLHHTNTPGPLATAIAPRAFLTAAHLAFGPGDVFILGGREFPILERTNLPGSDLALGRVGEDLAAWVPLYERDDELHRPVLVLGKGRWKGEPVSLGGRLRGWQYADSGAPGIRWGTNLVARLIDISEATPDGLSGFFLAADFDRDAGDHEVHATFGDSGGPVFIDDCGTWKLAAVLSSVDGPFRRTAPQTGEETPFLAALFDARDLYFEGEDGVFERVPDPGMDQPTAWYAARIGPRRADVAALAGLPAVRGLPRPPDVFAFREGDGPLRVSLAGIELVGVPEAGLECVESRSRGGAPVELEGLEMVFGLATNPGGADSARFVMRVGDDASAWGTVYVTSPIAPTSGPRLMRDAAGTAVGSWPIDASGTPRAEVADSVGGPWELQEREAVRMGNRWWVADDAAPSRSERFYRLRYDP
ncbi:MAG: hypothetical protein AB7O66_11310 [Limisphaerales bacterium]